MSTHVLTYSALGSGLTSQLPFLLLLGAPAFLLALALGLSDWQRSVRWLVMYVPYSGILGIALYPSSFAADAVTDFLFVLPVVIGAFLDHRFRINKARLPVTVVYPLLVLSAFVVLQVFNPAVPSILVGLVGVRGWLWYLPLIMVGFRFAFYAEDVVSIMRTAALAGLPVLLVGLAETTLMRVGLRSVIHSLYGKASAAAFAGQTSTAPGGLAVAGGGSFDRIPSLFSFALAYFTFSLAMIVPAYTLYRMGRSPKERRLGLWLVSLASICCMTSGTRLAVLVVPVMLLVTFLADPSRRRIRLALGGAAFVTSALVIQGLAAANLPYYFGTLIRGETNGVLVKGFALARRLTLVGLGSGMDTNASRDVAGPGIFNAIGGHWQESYFVQAWLELGVLGLVVVVWELSSILVSLWRAVKKRSVFRPFLAAVFAFTLAAVAISLKGSILDQAPVAIYVWLFVGLALGSASKGRVDSSLVQPVTPLGARKRALVSAKSPRQHEAPG